MSGRAQPENGADSEYIRFPYRVLVTEEVGDRFWVTVNAMGPNEAMGLAVEEAIDRGYSDVTAHDAKRLMS